MSWTSFWTKWTTLTTGEPGGRAGGQGGGQGPVLTTAPAPPRRTVKDLTTGHDLRLTDEQVALVHRLQRGQFGDVSFDPYEVGGSAWPWGLGHRRALAHSLCLFPQPAVDFFSGDLMIHPVTGRPADKRSFIPSLVEKEKVGAPLGCGAHTACPDHVCLPAGLSHGARHQDGLDPAPAAPGPLPQLL